MRVRARVRVRVRGWVRVRVRVPSRRIVLNASPKPAYWPGRVWMRVFTTSSGTTTACVSAQPRAPLSANRPNSLPPSRLS